MIGEKLTQIVKKQKCTLLGVGPMSKNCVDASIELSYDFDVPLILIASRRQIDSHEFGGGYVNNWTTNDFANYVIDNDKKGNIILARDHGGPWQSINEIDQELSLKRAMESAKNSYTSDIEAGFQILHIDPSIDIHNEINIDLTLERIFELYEFCWAKSQQLGKEIIFEIGTEEQSGSTNTQEELDYTLSSMRKFCNQNHLPFPNFVVIQSGTKVKEMRNVGSFDSPVRIANELPIEIQLPRMIEICNKFGIMMKVHNTDYLSDESLAWHPRLGIHAANVAPEFGVSETIALLKILDSNGLKNLSEKFLSLSYDSKKWQKWMISETNSTDKDKAIIAGHYIFSSFAFVELKKEASKILYKKGINLDYELKKEIKKSISRYLTNFRLIK